MNKKGFTLIELLVVISIIGLLSSVVLASLRNAREKAQIAKFKQEMQSVKNALELYKSENSEYPSNGDEINFTELLTTYLSPYISNTIILPTILDIVSGPRYMFVNDPSSHWWISNPSCGTSNGTEEYIIYFQASENTYTSQFPALYDGSILDGFYCAFTPPK